jgi:hypothetical protein
MWPNWLHVLIQFLEGLTKLQDLLVLWGKCYFGKFAQKCLEVVQNSMWQNNIKKIFFGLISKCKCPCRTHIQFLLCPCLLPASWLFCLWSPRTDYMLHLMKLQELWCDFSPYLSLSVPVEWPCPNVRTLASTVHTYIMSPGLTPAFVFCICSIPGWLWI